MDRRLVRHRRWCEHSGQENNVCHAGYQTSLTRLVALDLAFVFGTNLITFWKAVVQLCTNDTVEPTTFKQNLQNSSLEHAVWNRSTADLATYIYTSSVHHVINCLNSNTSVNICVKFHSPGPYLQYPEWHYGNDELNVTLDSLYRNFFQYKSQVLSFSLCLLLTLIIHSELCAILTEDHMCQL
jgi:hypothetical protein